MSPAEFWRNTPREFGVIMAGAVERERRQLRRDQGLLYSLAVLIGYSMHKPAKMPKFEKVFPSGRASTGQDADEIYAAMTAWCEVADVVRGK